MLWDERHERLVPSIGRGFSAKFMAGVSFTPGQGVAGRLAQTGQTKAVPDFAGRPACHRDQIAAAGIRSIIYAPIRIRDELFGIFSVDWEQPRTFDAGAARLMQALAKRAAVAIENARLFEHAEQAGALEERQKLARELHDSVSQALYGIALGAQTALGALEEDRPRDRWPAQGRSSRGAVDRPPYLYHRSTVPSSEHAAALAGVLERRLAELPRDREVVAYCRGPYCVYSDEAAEMLRRHGFTVRRLEESFPEWRAAGLPVEGGAPPEQTAIKSPHRQLQDKG